MLVCLFLIFVVIVVENKIHYSEVGVFVHHEAPDSTVGADILRWFFYEKHQVKQLGVS